MCLNCPEDRRSGDARDMFRSIVKGKSARREELSLVRPLETSPPFSLNRPKTSFHFPPRSLVLSNEDLRPLSRQNKTVSLNKKERCVTNKTDQLCFLEKYFCKDPVVACKLVNVRRRSMSPQETSKLVSSLILFRVYSYLASSSSVFSLLSNYRKSGSTFFQYVCVCC